MNKRLFFKTIIFYFSLILFVFCTALFAQPKSEAERLWELGEKAYNEGRYKEAIIFYEKSLSLCGKDNECTSSNLNGIGTSYEALGDDLKALSYYERALNISRKTNNKDILATTLFNVGAVYYRQAIDYEKAYTYLDESSRLFKELNDKNSLGIVLHYLGKVSSLLGKYEKALQSFNETLKIVKEQGNQKAIGANLTPGSRITFDPGASSW
ncbi:MAG TPA: tetratricopeptide repeat protein, partial [Syntrophorhabdaceae bacterium]|nr:tetratricopeptide repeat protein [Syntrophorhabdaceae bacterium]